MSSTSSSSWSNYLNPTRLRSYVFRLPLFTRIVVLIIFVLPIIRFLFSWNVAQWGMLIPSEVGLGTMYRLNTYPLVHVDLLQALLNAFFLTPLLERYERDSGTLLTAAMFVGPLSTLPAVAYLIIEMGILRGNAPILGASLWICVMCGIEAINHYRANPYLSISTYRVPTWITPVVLLMFASALGICEFLGHLCCIGVGYIYGLGYLKVLAPPEKILRWIEGKLNLLGRLPHYVSVDQKTFGRYGVLPSTNTPAPPGLGNSSIPMGYVGSTQRLGP